MMLTSMLSALVPSTLLLSAVYCQLSLFLQCLFGFTQYLLSLLPVQQLPLTLLLLLAVLVCNRAAEVQPGVNCDIIRVQPNLK